MNNAGERALSCLGKGFDCTNDFRLQYCKGGSSSGRLVVLDEGDTRDVDVAGYGILRGVPADIKCGKGERIRYQSDVLPFKQMSELLNRKSCLPGNIPSGLFNSTFGFSGCSRAVEESETKSLAFDGCFISLFDAHIDRRNLVLTDRVKKSVPVTWNPAAMTRFIETYGTHIIVGLSVGGQDVVYVRQTHASTVLPSELKKHLGEVGDQLFTEACVLPPLRARRKKQLRTKMVEAFNIFEPQVGPSCPCIASKDGITVFNCKRGGNASINSHCEWLLTVPNTPDAINFVFAPITSLLAGLPGKGFLSHAINLYLRYKPPIEDLEYFLHFQSPKVWAPLHGDLPLGPPANRTNYPSRPALQFSLLMGPKLYVNTTQVMVGRRPVTGMRMHLEGVHGDRLAIHLQHLSHLTPELERCIVEEPFWRGADDLDSEASQFYEAMQWKGPSHVCTAPVSEGSRDQVVRPTLGHLLSDSCASIITGAQLEVVKHESRHVLRLRLAFCRARGCRVIKSTWQHGSSGKSGSFSGTTVASAAIVMAEKAVIDSGIYPDEPPSPAHTPKGLRFVDPSQVCMGSQDCPGHWLATGARLDLEKGKIRLLVEFSLLHWVV